MDAETTVKRIGGSTFALLPPDVVRALNLKADDRIRIDVRRAGATADELLERLRGKIPNFPRLDRADLWGE